MIVTKYSGFKNPAKIDWMITRIKTLDLCNPVENKYVVFEENHWILKSRVGCSAKNQPTFWLFSKIRWMTKIRWIGQNPVEKR
jgi:hypothetical protein